MQVDINFDFTKDTPNYWKDFWNDEILGGGTKDPDVASKTLQAYHQILWSKQLPNGEYLLLQAGNGKEYLSWNGMCFGSDSIIVSFRYKRYKFMLEQVASCLPDYKGYIEDFLRRAYTIGGMIIFPKENSINRARGTNPLIKDRWDLTLECIRRYYNGENSPLHDVLVKNKEFFDLFVDFKGYVDFFFLQDCVSEDYQSVIFWLDHELFEPNPLPSSPEEYLLWIEKQLEFTEKRNQRIKEYLEKNEGTQI